MPDLKDGDPCGNISSQYLPSNVTRQANLPPTDFTLIAIAPWISVECTQAYLAAARLDPARAFLFYLVGNWTVNGTTLSGSTQPPPISSPVWDLHDGGRWRSANSFPIYALPTDVGNQLMHELSLYSGNMTDVPNGHNISEVPGADPRDYVRLYTAINTSNSSNLPSLWVFLVIVVGILAFMLGATSAAMHLIQRARRNSLRRRILNGEVDLEALGIKRLTVPQEVIEKCPLFTYNYEEEKSTGLTNFVGPDISREVSHTAKETLQAREVLSSEEPRSSSTDELASNHSSLAHKFLPYSQPTCPICLEDFKSGITPIRELPCGHIFHPECIDSFLSNNSSLCPMCKKSVLPAGYCPARITNSIVRRERNLRRLRSRVTVNEEGGVQIAGTRMQGFSSDFRRIFHRSPAARYSPATPGSIPLQPRPVLVADATTLNPRASVLGNEISPSQDVLSRDHVDQRRIQDLSGEQHVLADDVSSRRRSKCTFSDLPFDFC